MHISNSYSLQRKMEKKKGLYEKTHNVSLILKIVFLLSISGVVWNLWMLFLTGSILIADVLLNIYRSKILYTYRYSFINGFFYVIKIDLDGREETVRKRYVKDISSVAFEEPIDSDQKYYSDQDDRGDDKPMKIDFGNESFFILSDEYLYSILQYAMRENI